MNIRYMNIYEKLGEVQSLLRFLNWMPRTYFLE